MNALLVIDVQNDFLEGEALGARDTGHLVPGINRLVSECSRLNLPVFFTRDWHPANHGSFRAEGGIWPPHCVQNTHGARFADGLSIPQGSITISKGQMADDDGYSMFEDTSLEEHLARLKVKDLAVCGIATEYCVLESVRDAALRQFSVTLLIDLVCSIEASPGDSFAAVDKMRSAGAVLTKSDAWLAKLQTQVVHR
jgi:nicotinamidase/pyrazinamidase